MSTEAVKQSSLEDLMVAMDVVDTLRHRQGLVERELDAENRRKRLVEKLKEIYQAQGIEVTDALLAEGVDALEQERFSYQAPKGSLAVTLAKIYVARARWLKPLGIALALLFLLCLLRFVFFVYPQAQELETLPAEIGKTYSHIQKTAENPAVAAKAKGLVDQAAMALNDEDLTKAKAYYQQLLSIKHTLQQAYRVRIISRPGEMSGVWRIPSENERARNYYLIVEAIDDRGQTLKVDIINEENNQSVTTDTWGIRVDEATFQAVAADKQDDGIIQRNIVGEKVVGQLRPNYLIKTSGASITSW